MSATQFPSDWTGTPYDQLYNLASWATFEAAPVADAAWSVVAALESDGVLWASGQDCVEWASGAEQSPVQFATMCGSWADQVAATASLLSAQIAAHVPDHAEVAASVVEGVGAQGTRANENVAEAVDNFTQDLADLADRGLSGVWLVAALAAVAWAVTR